MKIPLTVGIPGALHWYLSTQEHFLGPPCPGYPWSYPGENGRLGLSNNLLFIVKSKQ